MPISSGVAVAHAQSKSTGLRASPVHAFQMRKQNQQKHVAAKYRKPRTLEVANDAWYASSMLCDSNPFMKEDLGSALNKDDDSFRAAASSKSRHSPESSIGSITVDVDVRHYCGCGCAQALRMSYVEVDVDVYGFCFWILFLYDRRNVRG